MPEKGSHLQGFKPVDSRLYQPESAERGATARVDIACLTRRLEQVALLSIEERRALELACGSVRQLAAHTTLVFEGDPAQRVNVVLEGFACRYRLQSDGSRQVVGLLLPGDMCDIRVCILRRMDHSIDTLNAVRVAQIPHDQAEALLERFPQLSRAFWWSTLVEESITREWLVSLGHRTAVERLAHLFCEIFERLHTVGLTRGDSCDLPLTQSELSDALGLSAVHVNRVLMELRHDKLITFRKQQLTFHDHAALRRICGFNPLYLHLDPAIEASSRQTAPSNA